MKMPEQSQVMRLLRKLHSIAVQAQSEDAQLLKEMEKCPSSKAACSILAGALNSHSGQSRDELLLPAAGWIHPLV